MDAVLAAPLGLRLHRNTLTRQDAVVVPTRLGLLRLRRGGSESAGAGVSAVRLMAPPEVSVRRAVLGDRRLLAAGPTPAAPKTSTGTVRTCCGGRTKRSATRRSFEQTEKYPMISPSPDVAALRGPSRSAPPGSKTAFRNVPRPEPANKRSPSTDQDGKIDKPNEPRTGPAAWNRELGARLLPLLSVLMSPRDAYQHGEGTSPDPSSGQRVRASSGPAADNSPRAAPVSAPVPRLAVTSITVPDVASAREALHLLQRQERASRATRRARHHARTPIAAAAAAAAVAAAAKYTNNTTQTTSTNSSRSNSSSSGGVPATGNGRRTSDSGTGSRPATTRGAAAGDVNSHTEQAYLEPHGCPCWDWCSRDMLNHDSDLGMSGLCLDDDFVSAPPGIPLHAAAKINQKGKSAKRKRSGERAFSSGPRYQPNSALWLAQGVGSAMSISPSTSRPKTAGPRRTNNKPPGLPWWARSSRRARVVAK